MVRSILSRVHWGMYLLLVVLVAWYSYLQLSEKPTLQLSTASAQVKHSALETKAASMVDESQCAGCHAEQSKDWKGSHHQLAMQEATDASVLGDFNDTRFQGEGETTLFFRKDGGFWVNTPGTDGEPADYRIAYTFGVDPLQQYLIEVPGGRLQALSVAWDVSKHAWFHLYPGQGVNFKNPLHWSRPQQNANFMCVECHTTGFKRNYDKASDRFASSWNSVGVGCQACHGPASQHLDWATSKLEATNAGFDIGLSRANNVTEVETCARCHARRAPLGDGFHHGQRLMDDYLLSTLTPELHELDGKIKDEVFEYGAFTQSKMFAKGVRCSSCHNPHSTELKAPANGVCLQCHNPAGRTTVAGIDGSGLKAKDYESPEHHHHSRDQVGSQCVNCHMPGKLYMVNDYRHDHGFTIPNPVRALHLGLTDACLACHSSKPGNKIAEQFRLWYGENKPSPPRYDESLWLIRNGRPGAAEALYQQLELSELPAIRRATLLAELSAYPSQKALELARKALLSDEPQVRQAAVAAMAAMLPPEMHLENFSAILEDPVRAVRIEVTQALLGLSPDVLQRLDSWNKAAREYEEVHKSLAERAEANLNLAMFYQSVGRTALVEPSLRDAIRRDPEFLPAQVLLAQWLDRHYRTDEARKLLQEAIEQHPASALLRHANGLALIRRGERKAALKELIEAARLEPDNVQFNYVLAVALDDAGERQSAIERLESLLSRQPGSRLSRLTLIKLLTESGQDQKTQVLLDEFRQLNPSDPALRQPRQMMGL